MVLSRAHFVTAIAVWTLWGSLQLQAQLRFPQHWQWQAGLSSHLAGYSGDIGNKGDFGGLSDTQWDLVQGGIGLHFRGEQRGQRMGFNLDLRHIPIQGADSLSNNVVAQARNLHFRNRMTELAVTADFPLLRFNRPMGMWTFNHQLRFVAGVALLRHAPEAQLDRDNLCYAELNSSGFNTPGQWHDLREARTEGIDYAKSVMTAPVGMSWTCSVDPPMGKPWHITFSALWRFTGTDRLDDIHGRYVDPNILTPLGFGLSSQANPDDMPVGDGVPGLSTYQYQQGVDAHRQAVRGNAASKDQYWTLGVTVAKSLSMAPANAFHQRRFRGPRVENKR